MVHLLTLVNVLVRMRHKNKRIFLSFCVFTTMSHVPTSMCNLFNNLANVSTIQILHVHEAVFGTRLFFRQGVHYKVYKYTRWCSVRDYSHLLGLIQNRKTKKQRHPRTCYFRGSHMPPFRNSIRIHPIPRNNNTAGFHTFRLTQNVRHMSQAQSVPAHVMRTNISLWGVESCTFVYT